MPDNKPGNAWSFAVTFPAVLRGASATSSAQVPPNHVWNCPERQRINRSVNGQQDPHNYNVALAVTNFELDRHRVPVDPHSASALIDNARSVQNGQSLRTTHVREGATFLMALFRNSNENCTGTLVAGIGLHTASAAFQAHRDITDQENGMN